MSVTSLHRNRADLPKANADSVRHRPTSRARYVCPRRIDDSTQSAGYGSGHCSIPRVRSHAAASESTATTSSTSSGAARSTLTRHSCQATPSQHQHCVAEAVEAVALLDREPVEAPRLLDPRERHDERE